MTDKNVSWSFSKTFFIVLMIALLVASIIGFVVYGEKIGLWVVDRNTLIDTIDELRTENEELENNTPVASASIEYLVALILLAGAYYLFNNFGDTITGGGVIGRKEAIKICSDILSEEYGLYKAGTPNKSNYYYRVSAKKKELRDGEKGYYYAVEFVTQEWLNDYAPDNICYTVIIKNDDVQDVAVYPFMNNYTAAKMAREQQQRSGTKDSLDAELSKSIIEQAIQERIRGSE